MPHGVTGFLLINLYNNTRNIHGLGRIAIYLTFAHLYLIYNWYRCRWQCLFVLLCYYLNPYTEEIG